MQRRYTSFHSTAIGREMELLVFGHHGPPMVAFPSGGGRFFDWENNGMIEAVAYWLDAGKVTIYCPDSLDHETWLNHSAEPAARGRRHSDYERYIVAELTAFIRDDCQSPKETLAAAGCSLGGLHAANFALKYPETFDYALCMSGRYDLVALTGHSDSLDVYYSNPLAYCYHLHGSTLEQVQNSTHLTLVCGQGAWEEKCLAETNRLAAILTEKDISHERDIWGRDVEHHWYWWKRQVAHHFEKTLG